MRRTSLVLIPTLFILLTAGCQQPAQEMAPRTVQEVEDAFEAVRAEWQALANADDAAGVAAFYAEDAQFTDPYGNIYTGRAAITEYLQQFFAAASDISIQRSDLVAHGDMMAASGTYSQTVQGPEGAMTMSGMWQTVSLFQPDGSMQLRLHQTMLPAEPPPGM